MAIFTFVLSLLFAAVAMLGILSASTSIHQIYAGVFGIISAVLWSGSGIMWALDNSRPSAKQIGKTNPTSEPKDAKCQKCGHEITSDTVSCPQCRTILKC